MSAVLFDDRSRTVRFPRPGMELNLGSIGKGYALDRMATLMRARGAAHALFSAGGSSAVAIEGRGAGWTVDLRSRQVASGRLALLRLLDGALAPSGAVERFFEVDGRRFAHAADPHTSWPPARLLHTRVVA